MSTQQNVLELLRNRALMRDVKVTLASGKPSTYYIDCKRVSLHGPSLKAVSKALVDRLEKESPRPTHVAGVSVGGDPLVAGVILEAESRGWELGALLVRKEKKSHGLSQGRAVDGVQAGDTACVWLVEDVVSTGGSSLTAAQHLRDEGYPLKGVLSIVDRQMGGLETLRERLGMPAVSLFKVEEIAG